MADAKIVFSGEDQSKAAVDSVNRGLRSLGTTAVAVSGQTQQALRMLPAQITDIVTGLASGQAPLTVLIQQGGQLKDMFGGVGAAARAVTGYVAALINPVTLLAAGVGGLALAWHMADSEADGFTRAITKSGNAAGTTTAQMQLMAQRIGAVVGTVGQAADALTQLASTGQVPNDSLERYATLVVRLQKVGVAAKDTVADLAALGRDPVAAALRLNESMNFLEAGTFRQIKALVELGRTQEAADLAQKAFADAQAQRVPQMEASLSGLERGWASVLAVIKGVGNAVEDVFRQQPAAAILQRQVEEARQRNRTLGIGDASGDTTSTRQLQQQLDVLRQEQKVQQDLAATEAKRKDQVQAAVGFEQLREQSLSRQQKISDQQERARNLGGQLIGTKKADGSTFTQTDIDTVVGNIGYENTKRGIDAQISQLKTQAQVLEVRTQAAVAEIQSERAMGVINERAATELTGQAEIEAMERRRGLLVQEIALKARERDSEKEVADLRGQLAVADEQILARRYKLGLDLEQLDEKRERAIRAVISAEQDEAAQDRARAITEAANAQNAAIGAQNAWKRSLQESNEQVDFELSLLGKTTEEQAKLNEQRRIELTLRERKRQIDALPSTVDADERARQNTDAEQAAARALAKVDTRAYIDKWKSVNQQVSDGLYDVLTGRGKDAAERLKDIFGDLVLRPMLQPIANSITGAIMGGMGGGAGGLGGSFGGLGSLGSLASLGGTISSGISSVGSFLGIGGGAASADLAAAVAGGADGMAALSGASAVAGGAGMAGVLGSIGAAMPYIGLALIAAQGLGLFDHGGPKTESGFGVGVPTRGNPGSSQAIAQGIQQQYAAILGQLGVKGGPLDLGVFSATDPQGTAQTQLMLNAGINGSSVYSREQRTGGVENVGRSDAELQAAIAEDSTRAIFAAIKATDGLSDSMRGILATTDAYTSSIDDINKAMTRAVAAETQRRQLEEQIFALTHSEAENLAHQRQLEKDGLDETNKALADRIYALQDEKKAQEEAAAAIEKAQQSAAAASRDALTMILGVARDVTGYLDKLDATGAGLLSPEDQVSNARSQFDRQLGLARGGDRDALQSLTNYADQYIQAQTAYTASGMPTQDAIGYVRQSLSGIGFSNLQEAFTRQNAVVGADTSGAQQLAAMSGQLQQLLAVLASYAQRDLANGSALVQNTNASSDALALARVRAPA